MTTTKVTKRSGAYVFDADAGTQASLRTGLTKRHGTITVGGEKLEAKINDHRRTGVTVERGGTAVMRLDPEGSFLPGGEPAGWQVLRGLGGYSATLTGGSGRIEFQLSRYGKTVELSADGSWPQFELVALTACFALLTRRRSDNARTAAVTGGHG